jgi:hypothetical protein
LTRICSNGIITIIKNWQRKENKANKGGKERCRKEGKNGKREEERDSY